MAVFLTRNPQDLQSETPEQSEFMHSHNSGACKIWKFQKKKESRRGKEISFPHNTRILHHIMLLLFIKERKQECKESTLIIKSDYSAPWTETAKLQWNNILSNM